MSRQPLIVSQKPAIPGREAGLIASLLILTWVAQLRYPPLSFPHIGLLQLTLLALLAVMLPLRIFRASYGGQARGMHPAFVPGFLFVAWAIVRWATDGFNFTGAGDVGTILWAAVYLLIGWCITRGAAETDGGSTADKSIAVALLAALSAMGLACGIHAAWQYWVGYDQMHQELLRQIGSRAPDRTELGLLHHLKLRRVASIWGDPNSLATFSAMALCAALELISGVRKSYGRGLRVLGGCTVPAALLAIFYSGSRGGLLDALMVIVLFGGLLLYSRRKNGRLMHGSGAILAIVTALLLCPAGHTTAQQKPSVLTVQPASDVGSEADITAWKWRSNTVTERVHYLRVGARMVEMAPAVGLGPGSVERYFGRLKPPEARESRYLHNWMVQVWAELGAVGLAMLVWFIGAVAYAAKRNRIWAQPIDRAFLALFGLILFDALLQVTWNQRELMSTFGLVTGILMAKSAEVPVTKLAVPPTLRLALCILLTTVYALCETLFLSGKSAKYMAIDAMHSGDMVAANQYWSNASQWTPKDSEPYAARASIAASAGQFSAARLLLDKAIRLNPDSAALQIQMAGLWKELRQDEKAYKTLTKALMLYPSHPEYNYNMASTLKALGRRSEAEKFARHALEYNYLDTNRSQYQALLSELEATTTSTSTYD